MEAIGFIAQGLLITLLLAFSSAATGSLLGYTIYVAKTGKSRVGRAFGIGYVEFFKGIPVILQLPVLFYVIPAMVPALAVPAIPTAIILFTLNGAAAFPGVIQNLFPDSLSDRVTAGTEFKMSLLASVGILRKTVIYSSFVALITISDLFRNAMAVYTSTNIPYYIFGAMLVYLILSVGLKLVQKGLRILMFKPVAPEADQTVTPEESAD